MNPSISSSVGFAPGARITCKGEEGEGRGEEGFKKIGIEVKIVAQQLNAEEQRKLKGGRRGGR